MNPRVRVRAKLPRVSISRVTRSRCAIPALFRRSILPMRDVPRSTRNTKFPRNWMQRESSPRFGASATGNVVTRRGCNFRHHLLRVGEHTVFSVMVARGYLECRQNTHRLNLKLKVWYEIVDIYSSWNEFA